MEQSKNKWRHRVREVRNGLRLLELDHRSTEERTRKAAANNSIELDEHSPPLPMSAGCAGLCGRMHDEIWGRGDGMVIVTMLLSDGVACMAHHPSVVCCMQCTELVRDALQHHLSTHWTPMSDHA